MADSPLSNAARDYSSLYRQVFLTLLLMSLTPLIVLGLFSLDRIAAVYDEKVSSNLEAVASSKQLALDAFLKERIAQVQNLAFTHPYAELSDKTRLSEIFNVMHHNSHSFVDFGIIDMKGKHIAYVGPFDLSRANYSEADWFTQVVRKGVYVSDVFTGFRNTPHFIIAVLRHDGDHSFILRATIDMEAISAIINREQSSTLSDTFIINEAGVLQTNSRSNGEIMAHFTLPEQKLDSNRPMLTFTRNIENVGSTIVTMIHLKSMPWIICLMDDARAGLERLQELKGFIILFMILGGILSCIGAIRSTFKLVTSLKITDQAQAQMNVAILQSNKMAAMGKMAVGVAHEINNPLTLIQENAGWINDLLDEEDPKLISNFEELRESTKKIEQHVQRAKGITQRMLGFGRRMNPTRTEIFINKLADQAIEMTKNEAKNHKIEILREYDNNTPVILSDPAQIEQTFINIIDNAIDALGEGGSITISTACQPNGVKISIADTGPGIPPDILEHIFDPFFTTKKVGKGTGLGLAICYSLIEKLGGKLDVNSVVGKGTVFDIYLPLEPPVPALKEVGHD